MKLKKILITGVAGFIGFSLAKKLLDQNKDVKIIGIDNVNTYYSKKLKLKRLHILKEYKILLLQNRLSTKRKIRTLFKRNNFSEVINLLHRLELDIHMIIQNLIQILT